MDVSGTTSIMTRKDGVKLSDTITVCRLETAQESIVEIGRVIRVAVAGSDYAAVDAG